MTLLFAHDVYNCRNFFLLLPLLFSVKAMQKLFLKWLKCDRVAVEIIVCQVLWFTVYVLYTIDCRRCFLHPSQCYKLLHEKVLS